MTNQSKSIEFTIPPSKATFALTNSVGTSEKNEASEAVVVACVHLRLLLPDGGVWTSSGSRLDLGVLLLWGVTMRVDRRNSP